MSATTSRSATGAPRRPAYHAHAVMHCNLNTTCGERAAAFYMAAFAVEPRMRSVENDGDATAMGLGRGVASVTTFLYDRRGPRAAPALELVDWAVPATMAAGPEHVPSSFAAVGYRVPSLRRVRSRLAALAAPVTEVADGLRVRGEVRQALRTVDPDGVEVEVVEIAPAGDDPSDGLLSHERMLCTDLERTVAWYAAVGWVVGARGIEGGAAWASIVLPDDPTFSLEYVELARPGGGTVRRPANILGLYRIALAVDDVRAASVGLAADGRCGPVPEPATMPMPDVPTGGFTVLFLTDPDGAVVELVERPRSEVRRPSAPS